MENSGSIWERPLPPSVPEAVGGSSPRPLYVLDACSLLNLVASRRFPEIARATPADFLVPEQAATEALYVRRGGSGADADEREPVDLSDFQEFGLLTVGCFEAPAELSSFVSFAAEMDDGEAAACAMAVHRGGTLVSDDRKARRIMSQASPGTQLLTTSEVIKAWAERTGIEANALAHLLTDVEERGNFRPSRHDSLGSWWNAARTGV